MRAKQLRPRLSVFGDVRRPAANEVLGHFPFLALVRELQGARTVHLPFRRLRRQCATSANTRMRREERTGTPEMVAVHGGAHTTTQRNVGGCRVRMR